MKWQYPIKFDPQDYAGFIYKVEFPDGYWYVGRKLFHSTLRKKVPGKTRRKVHIKESDWQKYSTSSDHVKMKLKEMDAKWTILHLCKTKREMCYWEAFEILTQRTGQVDNKALNKQCPAIRQF